jgi:hypothetical protein
MDFNKNKERSPQVGMKNQATGGKGSPTIDTSQYVALVVRNNILKFHQDRTINDCSISDRNDYVEKSIFFSSLIVLLEALSQKLISCLSVSG